MVTIVEDPFLADFTVTVVNETPALADLILCVVDDTPGLADFSIYIDDTLMGDVMVCLTTNPFFEDDVDTVKRVLAERGVYLD